MIVALALALLIVVACAGYVYLTGRERRGWAAELDKERGKYAAENRTLIAKIQVLTAENSSHATQRANEDARRRALEREIVELNERTNAAERDLRIRQG